MRIEEITKQDFGKKIRGYHKKELYNLRLRCIQIYKKHFQDNFKSSSEDGIDRSDLMEKYRILIHELRRRGLGYSTVTKLDRAIFKKAMTGLAVENLGEIVLSENFMAISGAFLKNPKESEQVEVVVKTGKENLPEKVLSDMSALIKSETGKDPAFTFNEEGPQDIHIPIYDLVLRNRGETKRLQAEKQSPPLREDVEKPEVTETQVRIPVGAECDVTATLTIDADKGIKALYCGGEKRIRTYLFDKDKWTMETARAWIKDHRSKTEKDFSEMSETEILEKTETDAQRKRREAWTKETLAIQASGKKAKFPHKFVPAKFPWPSGQKRCLVCGHPPPTDGPNCKKDSTNADRLFAGPPPAKKSFEFKIVKIDKAEQIVGGIIYAPQEVDSQGDYTDEKEIQKAMYKFMEKYAKDSKRIKIQHQGRNYHFPILEVFQPEEDTKKGDQTVKKGAWWLMLKVPNKTIWNLVEKGRLTGFSLGGTAVQGKPEDPEKK